MSIYPEGKRLWDVGTNNYPPGVSESTPHAPWNEEDEPEVETVIAEIPQDDFIQCLLNLPTARAWVAQLAEIDAPTWEEQYDAMLPITPTIVSWDRVDGFDDFMHRIPKPDRHKLSDEPLMQKLIAAHAVETRPL